MTDYQIVIDGISDAEHPTLYRRDPAYPVHNYPVFF